MGRAMGGAEAMRAVGAKAVVTKAAGTKAVVTKARVGANKRSIAANQE